MRAISSTFSFKFLALAFLLLFLNSCYQDCNTIILASELDSACHKSEIISKLGNPKSEEIKTTKKGLRETELYYKVSNMYFTESLILYLNDSDKLLYVSFPKGMLKHCQQKIK